MVTCALRVACLVVLAIAGASASQAVAAPDIAWLGLFNAPLIEWLENENQLETLCSKFTKDSADWQKCRKDKLAPQVRLIRLWLGPSGQAALAGSLRLVATPGKGLQAFFVPPAGGAGMEFRPDLYDVDWGYGPFFHMTVLERRAAWFRLPEQPFPANTWINALDLGDDPHVRTLDAGEIVRSPHGDLFVIGFENGVLRARPEQPPDKWCDTAKPPPLKPWKELRIPFRDVYSPTGHLLLHIKYTRGC